MAYEELVRTPLQVLCRLVGLIGIDAPAPWLRDAAARVEVRPATWRSLPPEQVRALERTCGDSLAKLGYA